jgi:hypothetical protein
VSGISQHKVLILKELHYEEWEDPGKKNLLISLSDDGLK